MDLTYSRSPNGSIYAQTSKGLNYKCVFDEGASQLLQDESQSWFEDVLAPVSPQSSEVEFLFANRPVSVVRRVSQSNGSEQPNLFLANRSSSVARRALDYPGDSEANESLFVKRKKKNEKERLCHIIPTDMLYQCEEQFLRMIFACPAIWNHKIDIKDRHPETKSKKWITIKNDMVAYVKGIEEADIDMSKIKVDLLKNTWNHIREVYVRYKNDSQASSGSAAKDVDPPEHSELMREYDDMIVKRRQVSSLDDEGGEGDSGNKKAFYTPKNKHSKPNKPDDSAVLSPFIASATTFLSKLSDANATTATIATNPIEDKTVLFANSIIPDLKKFDDEHFALIKMIIAKDIYDVLIKQIEKKKN